MVDLRNKILAARKPAPPPEADAAAGGELRSIATRSNSPFGIFDREKKSGFKTSASRHAHVWADGVLRARAGRNERVILAVRDAARQAERLGRNPVEEGIYVAASIREGWNLKSDQLSKGLSFLEAHGLIRFTQQRRRGPHARFVLVKPDADI